MKKIYRTYILLFLLLLKLFSYGQDISLEVSDNFEHLSKTEQTKELAKLCWQNREKNSDLAIAYGKEGIRIAQKNKLDKQLSKLYNYVGVVYQHYKHDFSQAILYYDKGLEKSLLSNDSIEIAYVYNNLGDAFFATGNVALAKEYADKSLKIFLDLKNERGIAYSYINLGLVDRMNQRYESALQYFNKAIEQRELLNDSLGIASAILEVAYTLNEMGKSKQALKYFKESFSLHEKLKNSNYMAYSYIGMGDVYTNLTYYDSAYFCYNVALALDLKRNNKKGIILSNLGKATVCAHKHEIQAGEKIIQSTLHLAHETQNPSNILETYKTWSNFYNILEDYKKANNIYKNYLTVYDSLYSVQQFETMSELKNRFQASEDLYIVENNLKLKEQEQIYMIIILIMLAGAVFSLFYWLRLKGKYSKELEQSNQTKDQLFSIISHDLINPFNVLIGLTDIMLEDLNDNDIEQAKEKGHLIYKTSVETHKLITDLLNWARSQRDFLNIKPETFNIVDLFIETTAVFKQMADLKKIELNIPDTEPRIVYADKNLTRTVLINLIGNAIKFTNANGKIEVFSEQDTTNAIIHIKDNGIGINSKKASSFFKDLKIESTRGTNNETGTGLGLALCKEFVEKNNGTIGVESSTNSGSDFYFTLPLME